MVDAQFIELNGIASVGPNLPGSDTAAGLILPPQRYDAGQNHHTKKDDVYDASDHHEAVAAVEPLGLGTASSRRPRGAACGVLFREVRYRIPGKTDVMIRFWREVRALCG